PRRSGSGGPEASDRRSSLVFLHFSATLAGDDRAERLGIRGSCLVMPGRPVFSDSDFCFPPRFFCPKRSQTSAQNGLNALDHATARAVGEVAEAESRHLAPEEVLERIDSLSPEDKRRLKLIELRRLSGTDFQEGLLYQEAVCQAVLGERRCPRETAFVPRA